MAKPSEWSGNSAGPALEWTKRADHHGIDPEVIAVVHDRTTARVRSTNWSAKTTARATFEAVRMMRRLKAGGTQYNCKGEEAP